MGTDSEFATKFDLNAVDKRLTSEIKENREYIDAHSQKIARLEAVYQSLENLPLTITNLDKTITVISGKLESMDRNIEEVKESVAEQGQIIKEVKSENSAQSENIRKIDNKSKIDWAVFITNNFWKILSVCGIIYIVVRLILDGGVN